MIITAFFIAGLILPIICLICGVLLLKFPSKKINSLYGYRTKKSMQSQDAWDYSQILAGKYLVFLGLFLLLILLLISQFYVLTEIITAFYLFSGCILILLFIFFIENALNKKFQ